MGLARRLLNNKSHSNVVDYSMPDASHGFAPLDDALPPAIPQGQGSYSNQNQMMVIKKGGQEQIKDKDEALKMLYSMMMNRVNKKRQGNY